LVLDKKRDLTGIISKTTHFGKRKNNSLDEFLKMNTTYFGYKNTSFFESP
jgi:hypothetical protein